MPKRYRAISERYLETKKHLLLLQKRYPQIISEIDKWFSVAKTEEKDPGKTRMPDLGHYREYYSLKAKLERMAGNVTDRSAHNKLVEALEFLILPEIMHRLDIETDKLEREKISNAILADCTTKVQHMPEQSRNLYLGIYHTYKTNKLSYENIKKHTQFAEYFIDLAISSHVLVVIKEKLDLVKRRFPNVSMEIPMDMIVNPELFVESILKDGKNKEAFNNDYDYVKFKNAAEEAITEAWRDAKGSAMRNIVPEILRESRKDFYESFDPISEDLFESSPGNVKQAVASKASSHIKNIAHWYLEYEGSIVSEISALQKRESELLAQEEKRNQSSALSFVRARMQR